MVHEGGIIIQNSVCFYLHVFQTTRTQMVLCWKFPVLWYFEKSTDSRITFAPFFLISSSLFLLTTYSYDFEANACGWFPWYKTTSFMERALQPALIGHDVFQALWINTDAPALQVLSSSSGVSAKGNIESRYLNDKCNRGGMFLGPQVPWMVLCSIP